MLTRFGTQAHSSLSPSARTCALGKSSKECAHVDSTIPYREDVSSQEVITCEEEFICEEEFFGTQHLQGP